MYNKYRKMITIKVIYMKGRRNYFEKHVYINLLSNATCILHSTTCRFVIEIIIIIT